MASTTSARSDHVRLMRILRGVMNRLCADCDQPLQLSEGTGRRSSNYNNESLRLDENLWAIVDEKSICVSLTHKVWICGLCARVHHYYSTDGREGDYDSNVKIIFKDGELVHALTNIELDFLERAGGNTISNRLYEYYLPSYNASESFYDHSNRNHADFPRKKLSSSPTMLERSKYIKSKYIARLFSRPPKQVLNKDLNGSSLSLPKPDFTLPVRIADYFVTIGIKDCLQLKSPKPNGSTENIDNEIDQGIEIIENSVDDLDNLLNSVEFDPEILSSFPDKRDGSIVPEYIGKFVFPSGLKLSKTDKNPFHYTLVLSDEKRRKHYLSVLIVYEMVDSEQLLKEVTKKVEQGKEKTGMSIEEWIRLTKIHPVLFAPKALVVLSFYGFFELYRLFLQQLYRTSLSNAPLPIERYVENFMLEVPLPPLGRVEVSFQLPEILLNITRPAKNQLPMVDFSYKPLFSLLSIDNIMTIFSCLCREKSVCICCGNISLLTPIQEALLSFLFPFIFQGCYIPVLPTDLLELLETPVPFLVGISSDYLHLVQPNRRPSSVLFVHLEEDKLYYNNEIIRAGKLQTSRASSDQVVEEAFEILPLSKKNGLKLKKQIQQSSDAVYGHKKSELLADAGKLFPNNEHLKPIQFNKVHHSQLTTITQGSPDMDDQLITMCTRIVQLANGNSDNENYLTPQNNLPQNNFGPQNVQDNSTFNAAEIRNGFFRFNVASFKDYKDNKYWTFDGTTRKFKFEMFKNELNDTFLEQVVETQLFHNYINDCIESPDQIEIVFFDENIVAKRNRNRFNKKIETAFLDNKDGIIKESLSVPFPDRRNLSQTWQNDSTYFPMLRRELFSDHSNKEMVVLVLDSDMYATRSQGRLSLKALRSLNHQNNSFSRYISNRFSSAASSQHTENTSQLSTRTFFEGSSMVIPEGSYRDLVILDGPLNMTLKESEVEFRNANRNLGIFQSYLRMSLQKNKYTKMRRGFVRLQLQVKALAQVKVYRKLMTAVRVIQKYCRGCLARTRMGEMLKSNFDSVRSIVVGMWLQQKKSISYTSHFWLAYNSPTLLNIALYEDESRSIYNSVDEYVSERYYLAKSSSCSDDGAMLSLDKQSARLSPSRSMKFSLASLSIFTKEINLELSEKNSQNGERQRLYEVLRRCPPQELLQIYIEFSLDGKKKKKKTLAESLWKDKYLNTNDLLDPVLVEQHAKAYLKIEKMDSLQLLESNKFKVKSLKLERVAKACRDVAVALL